MTTSWWCILVKPNGTRHLYELGDEPYDTELAKVKQAQNVPDDWMERGVGWSLSVAPGEPHPTLIWSTTELDTARQQLEAAAGIPGQRAQLQTLEDALTAARATLPPDALDALTTAVRKARRSLRQIPMADISNALAAVPPSQSVVHRRPPQPARTP